MKRYISKAQENGDMSSVRIYENKLAAIETEGVRLNDKYASAKQDMDNLKAMNEKLSNDAATLEGKLSEIKAKLNAAESMQSMNKIANKAGAADTDEMFQRMNHSRRHRRLAVRGFEPYIKRGNNFRADFITPGYIYPRV